MVISTFISTIQERIKNNEFIKLSLGNYKGKVENLKNIYIKLILIKRELRLSFTYRYKTKDITKNYEIHEGIHELENLISENGFRVATLFNVSENLICEFTNKKNWITRSEPATATKPNELTHDKQKNRKVINSNKSYLNDLRLTDETGKVYKNAQDKWKQINHYIELLSSELSNLSNKSNLKVVDMGAGKGYLTFALYDYLTNVLNLKTEIDGVEFRKDLVDLCNDIAHKSNFDGLKFVEGTIQDYKASSNIDILIALHACDTATDDAIYKGIKSNAELIVVAPCCHKQIRREIEKSKPDNDLSFMTKHGIFLERHAEMLTDGIRALLLEYYGYQTKVLQFISDAHTPKNVMIIAVKKSISEKKQIEIKEKLQNIKSYYGLNVHYLEQLFLT